MSRKTPTYDECYAYIILKEIIGLNNFELSDKPDLVDEQNSIGIEIVNAIPQDVYHITNQYINYINEGKLEKLKNIETINGFKKNNGYTYNEMCIIRRNIYFEEIYTNLIKCINNKCNKKNITKI